MEENTQSHRALIALAAALLWAGCAHGPVRVVAPVPSAAGEPGAALNAAAQRYLEVARKLDPVAGQPRSTDRRGAWLTTGVNEWTSGFFPGALWYLFSYTGDASIREQAERWTWPLADIPRGTFSHDLGFQFNTSFLNAYRFTGDERYRAPALNAARLLAARFNPKVGAIKSWDWREPLRTFPVIADNMMNLELLFWGAQQPEGDPAWKEIAVQHARTTLAQHVRADGSSFHVVVFDTATGKPQERVTHQGYADTSTWARGQSWLIYGFTMAYRETRDSAFLAAARTTADFALAHLPADGIPCWDYDAPGCPATARRDASAAAIAASALLELSPYAPPADRERYRGAAEKIIRALRSPQYFGARGAALIEHAVGNHPAGTEIDVGIIYADYYFIEALLRNAALRGDARGYGLPMLAPPVFTARAGNLRAAKQRLLRGDAQLQPALEKLVRDADAALHAGPFTVLAKERVPPSGDKHDYVSYAPYWWPDSTKPNGLPFIRRDGQVNQTTRRDSDVLRWYAFTDAVETLALGQYFTGNRAYGERAALLLRTWFLDPATRMNPHLRFAQAIPGVVDGRGIGIIDTRDMGRLTDAISLLKDAGALSSDDMQALRAWFSTYYEWLRNSDNGKDEADEPNNHGTWYDVQVVALALFLGDTATARHVAEQARTKRIASQIDSLGHQPLELARTRSLHYSVENLDGMTRLAEMARVIGVDLWSWQAPNGGSIRKAIDIIAPYETAREKWPYPQITTESADLFLPVLRRAGVVVSDSSAGAREHRSRLLYPDATTSCEIECTLASQVIVAGRLTGWPEKSLISVPRTFETMQRFMAMSKPNARIRSAVHAAAAWLKEVALYPGPQWAVAYDIRTGAPASEHRIADEPRAALTAYTRWLRADTVNIATSRKRSPDALVDAKYEGPEGALVGGVRRFRRIATALSVAPSSGAPYVIRIANGRYYEKVAVEVPNVHFVGESRQGTVLTYDAAAATPAPSGGMFGTRGSSTLRIAAPGFRLENMTVENAFDYMANYAKPDDDRTKLRGTQGVAVMLDYGSDRAVFEDCVITGHQDTLFPNAGTSFFHHCTISGSVDFIFGAGRALFDDVDIISRDRGSKSNNGYITAPSTPAAEPMGFVIINSRLKKESPAMAPHTVTLGRPWHPAGDPDAIGSAVFINTWMDDHIGAKGWDSMNSTDAAGARATHRPEDARFFEFGSLGPGAVVSGSRRVLTASEAERIRTAFPNPDF